MFKKIELANAKEVRKVTGCNIGSVPPFGNLFNIKVYFDKSVVANDIVSFNAGTHTKSIKMKAKDLVNVVNPVVGEISKQDELIEISNKDDFSNLPIEEILDLLSEVVSELKKRKVISTNDIVGSLGEHYAIEKLNLRPMPKGFKGYDAEKDGIKFEIKTRQKVQEPYRKKESQYRLNGLLKDYDFLILVFLDEKFKVESMYQFPRKMFNKDEIPITQKLLESPEVKKII